MKPDELELLRAFWASSCGKPYHCGVTLRGLAEQQGMHWKRVQYLAWKWSDRGLYDYGVCADLGWLEVAGVDWCLELFGPAPTQDRESAT